MSNNIAWLYCPICNEATMLAKHFGTAFDFRNTPEGLDKFFRDHVWCIHHDAFLNGSHLQLRFTHSAIGLELPIEAWTNRSRLHNNLQEHREHMGTEEITRMDSPIASPEDQHRGSRSPDDSALPV